MFYRYSDTILANALVHFKLDYCNSLYYSSSNSFIHRLQLVQNSLARVVIPSTQDITISLLFLKDCIGYQLNSELNTNLLLSPINHFTISYHSTFMNSCLLLLNLVVVHLLINYLIFNVLIQSLV